MLIFDEGIQQIGIFIGKPIDLLTNELKHLLHSQETISKHAYIFFSLRISCWIGIVVIFLAKFIPTLLNALMRT
jgi:hypothetical protein